MEGPDQNPAAQPLPAISRASVATWRPWYSGPPELVLECRGSLPARAIAAAHLRWPFTRGHHRLVRTLPKHSALQRVPFRSAAGVDLQLDMTDMSFLYLSGRLPTEPLELAILNRLIRPGDVFVDVGAHRGLYITHMLGRVRPGGRMFAFEPSPGNVAFIRRTFGAPQGLELVEAAVGETTGEGVLVEDGSLEARLARNTAAPGLKVRLCRLDEVVRPPDRGAALVVKVDVEGDEAAVVRGALGLARRDLPSAWLLESLPGHGSRRADLLRTVESALPEAVIFAVANGRGLAPIATVGDDDPDVLNVLAVTPGMASRMSALRDICR